MRGRFMGGKSVEVRRISNTVARGGSCKSATRTKITLADTRPRSPRGGPTRDACGRHVGDSRGEAMSPAQKRKVRDAATDAAVLLLCLAGLLAFLVLLA